MMEASGTFYLCHRRCARAARNFLHCLNLALTGGVLRNEVVDYVFDDFMSRCVALLAFAESFSLRFMRFSGTECRRRLRHHLGT